jgi:hypothetical protein
VVKYIRTTNPAAADSLITGAYLDNLIVLVGDNLTSIKEMFFNDQKAILNTSYITDHTLLVAVPSEIPSTVTNKIYMVNTVGDTTQYDFNVLVPGPVVRSMSCEWAKAGTVATLYGDYLLDDENVPIKVTMPGNVQAKVLSASKTSLTFEVPSHIETGYINVTTIYGSGRSAFQFHDTRNILFDFDGSHGGHKTGYGWRAGMIHADGQDVEGIDGSYLYFGGADLSGEVGGTWAEDQFCLNYWPGDADATPLNSNKEMAEMLKTYGAQNLQVKFELYVPTSNPWKSCALQVMFTPEKYVSASNMNNAFYSDSSMARGLWIPWKDSGSYDTNNEWVTVSLPISNFTYDHEGGAATGSAIDSSFFYGLTLFVWHGGVEGTDCSPVMYIDNIRVVPIE